MDNTLAVPTSASPPTVRSIDSLGSLPKSAELLFETGGTNLFLTLPWFRNLVDTVLGTQYAVRLMIAESSHDRATALAVLPLRTNLPSVKFTALRKIEALTNYYSSFYLPIVLDSHQQESQQILNSLASRLVRADAPWDVIDLKPLPGDSELTVGLRKALSNAGAWVDSYFAFGNWYLEVNGRSFDTYFQELPSRLRNTMKRKRKQIENKVVHRIEIIDNVSDLGRALDAYERVYNASWKIPEPYPAFIRGLAQLAAERGWLRFGLFYIDDIPVAAQIWIVYNGIASIYKLAYDEAYEKYSAGSLLTVELMRHVIDKDRVAIVDYLTGDDGYKRDWMSHRREFVGIIAFNPKTLRGLIAAAIHYGGRFLRKLWSTLRPKAVVSTPSSATSDLTT